MTAPQPASMVIALTGGIAAGKSAVARRFMALGVHVHDADVAAREVVEPGTPGLAAIVETFGNSVLDDAGRLDRRAMRERIFANNTARQKLEAIVHHLFAPGYTTALRRKRGRTACSRFPCWLKTSRTTDGSSKYCWWTRPNRRKSND